MLARGVVTTIEGHTASVEVCEKDVESCGGCAISCDPRALGRTFRVELNNQMQLGSEVTLDVKMPSTYLAVTMLLLVPMILLVVGIVIGRDWLGGELAAFGLGVGFFFVGFGGARIFEAFARSRGAYKPDVLSVQTPEDPGGEK